MLRTLIVTAASSVVLLAASSAGAQEKGNLGSKGQLILSADRLVPLFAYGVNKTTDSQQGGDVVTTRSQPSFSLLPNFNTSQLAGNFYNVPRLSVDYTVIDRLTVGGSVILFFTAGGSTEVKQGSQSVSTDAPSTTLFGIAPRVGYILGLTDLFAFWPRGGFSFYSLSSKSTDTRNNQTTTSTVSTSQFAINLEPVFAITPVQNLFFIVGPVIDIPLTGTQKTETSVGSTTNSHSVDSSQFHFGLTAGLGGYINL